MNGRKLLGILLATVLLLLWLARDQPLSVAGMLPFTGGRPFGLYDVVAVTMVVWAALAGWELWQRR